MLIVLKQAFTYVYFAVLLSKTSEFKYANLEWSEKS